MTLKKKQHGNKGRKFTQEHKDKISKAKIGKPLNHGNGRYKGFWSDKGRIHPMKGKHHSKETILKLNDSHKGLLSGEKHPNWKGGLSKKKYSVDWKRDRYTCQICGKEPATQCHHIDYDKENCNPNNLITLCVSCHTKTNYKRKYWIEYFNNINI